MLLARSGWCVPSCGAAPEPDEPVAATVRIGPARRPALASGIRPMAIAVAKQPGEATYRAVRSWSRNSSGMP